MNAKNLIQEVSNVSGLTKKNSKLAIDAFVQCVQNALASGEDVKIVGFGTYSVVERAARQGRNMKTGEIMQIPQCKYPKFKASKNLKESVNK